MTVRGGILVALGVVAGLAGCSSASIDVQYDPETGFAGYRTWDWLPRSESPSAEATERDRHIARRFRKSVAEGLEARGFEKDSRGPDFLVTYRIGVRDRSGAAYRGFGRRGYMSRRGSRFETEYREFTVALQLFDAGTKESIWSGTAHGGASDSDDTEANLREALEALLARFPPGG